MLIRLLVGCVFILEGYLKFALPQELGVGRFTTIGIPYPRSMPPFVGAVEIVCGILIVLGLATRFAAIPLSIDMIVAITSTKVPIRSAVSAATTLVSRRRSCPPDSHGSPARSLHEYS